MAGSYSSNISQLGSLDKFISSDLFAVWTSNSRTQKGSVGQLLQYMQDNWSDPVFEPTINTPIEGFNISMEDNANNQWLLLTPASGLNTGTIVLPSSSSAADGQEVIITSTQQVTSLTLNANGATNIYGAISTIAAEGNVKYKYNKQTNSWYRIAK